MTFVDKTIDNKAWEIAKVQVVKIKDLDSKSSADDTKSREKKVKITYQIVEDAYKKLRDITSGESINVGAVVGLVKSSMKISNDMLNTDKQYKIELTLILLRKLIDDSACDVAERATLHLLIESTVPKFINLVSGSSLFRRLMKKCGCCSL